MALYQMDPYEIAGGWLNGSDPVPFPPDPRISPRQALERIVLKYLQREPCVIAFSGGRDSSALLAVTVAVARREGLPLPIPLILVYPGVKGTDESDWQHLVLDHLGLSERIVVSVDQEHDGIGPVATPVLLKHGLVYYANFAPTLRMMQQARGGVLLTGECGDEVFGPKRIAPLTRIVTSRGRVERMVYRRALGAVAPTFWRRGAAFRRHYVRPWLREPVEALLGARVAEDEVAYPLHAGRHAWHFVNRRCVTRGYETLCELGREIDVEYGQPFGDLDYVAAFAHDSGFWGWSERTAGGRTATMRRLFGDLLPRELLERSTKAYFNHGLFTEHTRSFARQWDGSGVDTELVDPEVLREIWLREYVEAPTMCLLQQAWLHSQKTVQKEDANVGVISG